MANIKDDLYAADERRLLDAWVTGRALTPEDEDLLRAQGFDQDYGKTYTRLNAWVGTFAVKDIQERLPNCGVNWADGRIELTRPIRKGRPRKVTGLSRFLFRINWADSGPGISWPADYHLVWLPGYERFVLTYSADSPEAMGYCDFALGSVGPDEDWREAARRILVNNWRAQFDGWDQAPWVQLWGTGLVTEEEAFAWRAEAWRDHESMVECTTDEDTSVESEEKESSS
jgi:hypothetical protein